MFTHLPLHTVPASLQLLAVVSFGCASRPATPLERVVASPPPLITAIFPSAGSTAGYTSITINGTGFQSGATVMVDDVILHGRIGASHRAPSGDACSRAGARRRCRHQPGRSTASRVRRVQLHRSRIVRHQRIVAGIQRAAGTSFSSTFSTTALSGVLHERCVVRMTLSPPLAVVDGAFALSRDDGPSPGVSFRTCRRSGPSTFRPARPPLVPRRNRARVAGTTPVSIGC